jgi:hypothetical protein
MRLCHFTAVMISALAVFSGCNTVFETDYKAGQTFLAENKSARRIVAQECAKDVGYTDIEKRELAAIMNVPESKVTEVACRRFTNAMASGRMTYDDYVNMISNSGDQSKILKILVGR